MKTFNLEKFQFQIIWKTISSNLVWWENILEDFNWYIWNSDFLAMIQEKRWVNLCSYLITFLTHKDFIFSTKVQHKKAHFMIQVVMNLTTGWSKIPSVEVSAFS